VPIRVSAPAGAPVWIDLSSSDPQRAKDFYPQLFGWSAVETDPEYGGYVNFAKAGELIAGMIQNQQEGTPDSWTTYLSSPDAKATADAVNAGGGQVLLEPMPVLDLGTMAVVADPGGAVVGVWQPGEMAGFGVTGEDGAPVWIELHTKDYPTVVPFYQQAFSWETRVMSDSDEFRYTVLEKDGEQYAGIMDASAFLPAGMPSTWLVYFQVPDVDAAVAKVEELGGSVLEPAEDTPYGRMAKVADPTGAVFKVMTPPW
jgi:uncharacterized protein